MNRGKYDDAIAAFNSLLESTEANQPALTGLAQAHIHVGAYDEARAILNKVELFAHTEALILRAEIHRILGQYEIAEKVLRSVIEQDKTYAGAYRALGDLLLYLGRRDEAIKTLRWFNEVVTRRPALRRDAGWLTDVGVGLLQYSVLTQTNVADRTRYVLQDVLQQAYTRVDRSYWPARIAAADILRRHHNNSPEDGSVSDYLAALEINERLCPAIVGLGEVLLEGWQFEKVAEHVQRALDINPQYPPAFHLAARQLILERKYEQAQEQCDRALELNERDLAALSLKAGAAACMFDDGAVAELERRVQSISPRCALFYQTLGDALGGIRQYDASERAYQKAIEYDPTDTNTRNELGMMYMQWGLEDKARDTLDAAWLMDPFNQRTKNTLDLLESIASFETYESPHFIVRYDAETDIGLGRRVAEYMESVYEEVVGDYEYPLEQKTIIEVFPTQASFAVRITGKPWIHTVGASTGWVIALASPRESAQTSGSYNLASVLKHEFTHTVTLAATKNRIPHWFTEGLAVWQENADRSFGWRSLLAGAVRHGELFTLETIDWAFMRPKRSTDRQMAYAQSEWMCEFIVDKFGYESINKMLARFREGNPVEEVLEKELGVTPAEFDESFATWAREDASAWGLDLTPPEDVTELRLLAQDSDNATLLGRLARAELDAGREREAYEVAKRALELKPSELHALEVTTTILMRLAKRSHQSSEKEQHYADALPMLRRLYEVDESSVTAARHLARIALDRKEFDAAIEPLRRLQALLPIDPMSWRGLGGIYMQRGDRERAWPQLVELARMDQHDAEVRFQLGAMAERRGRFQESRYWYRQALFIEPFNANGIEDYARACLRTGNDKDALKAYELLTSLEPKNVVYWEQAAQVAAKVGDNQKASELAKAAVRLNPDSSSAVLIRAEAANETKD